MKITSIECYKGLPGGGLSSYITVKVNTDEGISGFGEAGLAYGESSEAAFGQCQDFAKLVLGMDPFDTEKIWEHLHRHTFWGMGGGALITSAMAAIDTACWDIKGKALGVPVYQLIGGKTNKKLKAYASQLQAGWKKSIRKNDCLTMKFAPEEYYDVTKEAIEDGYDTVKIDPCQNTFTVEQMPKVGYGVHHRGCYDHAQMMLAYDRIKAAREAGGDDLGIIVEVHSQLDANTAAEFGKLLEPLHIMYFEEPTSPENADLFAHIKEKCDLPLATGERSYTRWGFRTFMEKRLLNIVQPDLANTGGITEAKKIADMAQVYDMGVQIHVCGGPIANAAALQVEAAIPNFAIHEEHCANLCSKFTKSGKYVIEPVNGYYELSDRPGIGQEMSEWAMETALKKVVIS